MIEYLIVRNKKNKQLFDVVAVHFERQSGQILKSGLLFEEAQEYQEYMIQQNLQG